jgi:hypothetical protein
LQAKGCHIWDQFSGIRLLAGRGREQKALGAADEGVATFVEAQELIGGVSDTYADGFSNRPNGMVAFSEPERALGAEVKTVVTAVDLERGGKAARSAGQIKKSRGLAVALHELDAIDWFESPNEDGRGDSSAFAHDIEHEVRAVVEKNVGMARRTIHRTNAWSRAAEMMSGGIAGRIGFCFDDAAAEAASGEIVDDNFSDQEARQLDGISRKFSATESADH